MTSTIDLTTTETTDSDLDAIATALADLSTEIDSAATVEVDDTDPADPMARMQLDDLLGGCYLLKGDQTARTFVKGKEIYRNPDVVQAERDSRTRNADKLRKRVKRAQERRARLDAERTAKPLDSVRMSASLALLGNITHVIADLTMQRYNRFRRTLGDVSFDDIAQDAILSIAEAMARSDTDIVAYAEMVLWLKDAPQPYVAADGPAGVGRLIGTIIRVIGTTIVDVYRRSTVKTWTLTIGDEGKEVWTWRDTTVQSLDRLTTVARATSTDVDTLIGRHKAGGKPPKPKSTPPGGKDKRLFARQVIDCAIEARGLGWLATMLLDDDRRRTDGSFKWTENADEVWAGFGFPPMSTDSPRLKAAYAKRAVQLAFAFLPEIVTEVYEIIATPEVMWHLGATSDNKLVERASRVVSDLRQQEHQHAIDGGVSLDMTLRMIEDSTYRARSIACILAADDEDDE